VASDPTVSRAIDDAHVTEAVDLSSKCHGGRHPSLGGLLQAAPDATAAVRWSCNTRLGVLMTDAAEAPRCREIAGDRLSKLPLAAFPMNVRQLA
jgi:hypothetical protein